MIILVLISASKRWVIDPPPFRRGGGGEEGVSINMVIGNPAENNYLCVDWPRKS